MEKSIKAMVLVVVAVCVWKFGPDVWRLLQGGANAITGKTAIDIGQDMKRSVVESQLEHAFGQYRALEGRAAQSLDELVTAGFLPSADLRDEWGRALGVESQGGRMVVRGRGVDGLRGTADDWLLVP